MRLQVWVCLLCVLSRYSKQGSATSGGFGAFQTVSTFFRTHSTTTRDRNLQFRGAVSIGFLEFSPVDFFPFLQVFCLTQQGNRPKMCRKLPGFRAEKKRRILSRLWLSWFFRSRFLVSGIWMFHITLVSICGSLFLAHSPDCLGLLAFGRSLSYLHLLCKRA